MVFRRLGENVGARSRRERKAMIDRANPNLSIARQCEVLSWRLSNTMDSRFCVEALEDALTTYGAPDIFNTDQGRPFTSFDFTGVLKDAGVAISMDGRAATWTTSLSNACGRCVNTVAP